MTDSKTNLSSFTSNFIDLKCLGENLKEKIEINARFLKEYDDFINKVLIFIKQYEDLKKELNNFINKQGEK